MKRLLPLFIAALAVLLGAACGDVVDSYAAKVNGTRITQDALDEELNVILDNKELLEGIEAGLGPGQSVRGTGKGTVNSSFAARLLTRRIFLELIHQEVERRNLEISPAQMDEAEQQAQQQFGSQETFDKFPESYRNTVIRANAEVGALQADVAKQGVTQADVQRYYDENASQFRGRCVSHILVDSKEQADQLKAQIDGGADFAELAAKNSKDNQGPSGGSAAQGGSLGCFEPGQPMQFVPEFKAVAETLPPGQVSAPVQSQFGFHIIKVADVRTFPEAEQEIRQQLGAEKAQSGFDELLLGLVDKAKIEVNPKYGHFSKARETLGVVAPEAPKLSQTTTTVPLFNPVPGDGQPPAGDAPPAGATDE